MGFALNVNKESAIMKQNKPPRKIHILAIFLLMLMLVLGACQPALTTNAVDDSRLIVTVSILPQAYFVERIGGDTVSINVMVGPGEEPHTYEPKPDQMRALSYSQLFFTIGTEYEEAWLTRFRDINPALIFIDSADGIRRLPLSDPHQHNDQAEAIEDHSDESEPLSPEHGLDPHIWLAPANGKVIATNILNALKKEVPSHANTFQANYDALLADIDVLDQKIQNILNDVEQRSFMVFHPAWGYFAAQYDLKQIPIQIGGLEPSANEMTKIITIARSENIRVIFTQPTFSTANAEAIAQELNAEIAVVDPLAQNWLENLETVAGAFAAALH